jgi:hypothetical protein
VTMPDISIPIPHIPTPQIPNIFRR